MGVQIREQKRTKKKEVRLYLDCYHKGQRHTLWPDGLVITADMKAADKRRIREQAERLRLAKLEEIRRTGRVDGHLLPRRDFLDFFKEVQEKRHRGWHSVYHMLLRYVLHLNSNAAATERKTLRFDQIDGHLIEDLKAFMLTKISSTTAYNYFTKIIAALDLAVTEGLITDNPAKGRNYRKKEFPTVYLTQEEVKRLIDTPEPVRNHIKNAFIFCIYTGLRISDVRNLRWYHIEKIMHKGEGRYQLNFSMKKTQAQHTLPLPKVSLRYLGEIKEGTDRVFELFDEKTMNNDLRRWCETAGIKKYVTIFNEERNQVAEEVPMHWHVARHTFACMHIQRGTDIYILSRLMGHKTVATTQRYAKVMGVSLIEASDNLTDL